MNTPHQHLDALLRRAAGTVAAEIAEAAEKAREAADKGIPLAPEGIPSWIVEAADPVTGEAPSGEPAHALLTSRTAALMATLETPEGERGEALAARLGVSLSNYAAGAWTHLGTPNVSYREVK